MGRVLGVGAGGITGGGGVGAGGGASTVPGIGGLVTGGRTAVELALLPDPVFTPSSTVIFGGGVGFLATTMQAPNEADATTVTIMGEANVRRGARADMA